MISFTVGDLSEILWGSMETKQPNAGSRVVAARNALRRVDGAAWRRFGSAMGGLGLGFLLAIYSNIFTARGRVGAAAICASLALLLSGYVAVTAVPYLARRSSFEWLKITVDYQLTREGMAFIGLVFLLAIAGLNTGNNLLYLVVASLLAAILMSGVLSLAVLRGLSLEINLPEHVFARRPVPARIRLENKKRFLPSFSITLSGTGQTGEKPKRKLALANPSSLASSDSDGRILNRPLYFAFLPAARALTRPVQLEFPHRGLYREKGFALSTRFPFGFLEKKLVLAVSRDLWVYPAVEPAEDFYEILPLLSGELEAYQRGRGHDLYSIREMLSTDSARFVDWKASARSGGLKVREFAREDERRLQLILDPRIGPFDEEALRRFEAAVEICASLAWHFYEVDAQLQFLCGDFQTPTARAGEVIYDILRYLSTVAPSPDIPLARPAAAADGVFQIIFTGAPQGSIPTTVWNRSYFIFFDSLRTARSAAFGKTRTMPSPSASAPVDGQAARI